MLLRYMLMISFFFFSFIDASKASDSEGIHFLAIDLPGKTTEYIRRHTQPFIQELIREKAPEYSERVVYHKPENIHISLIRFDTIPEASLEEYIKLLNKHTSSLPDKNIVDKVKNAKITVTKSGFIVYQLLPEPKSLTAFVGPILKDLDSNTLHYADSDFSSKKPVFAHFSVAYFNPNDADLHKTMNRIFGSHDTGNKVPPLECDSFPLHEFHLKQSKKGRGIPPLTYENVHSFKKN